MSNFKINQRVKHYLTGFLLSFSLWSAQAHAEWNADWTTRTKVSVNAVEATEALSNVPVAVRLHSGNFDFTAVNIDGSDLRFIAADDKTEREARRQSDENINEFHAVRLPRQYSLLRKLCF